MLVDDHPTVRAGLEQALIKANFTVCAHAASKNEAIAQIAHTNPDLILLDLNLPDGSGFEVANWARDISDEIGIVILTLNDAPEFLIAALASRAGLSASFMSLVVADKRQLSPPSILVVADILGVKPKTLLTADQMATLKVLQACV